MDYPYGPFRPDAAGPNTGFAQIAEGVLPRRGAPTQSGSQMIVYGPAAAFVTTPGAGALPAAPRGSISLQLQDGSWQTFVATAAVIDQLQSDATFASIETGRTVTSGADVSFCHYGAFLLNSDTTDGAKAYNLESPGSNTAISGALAARAIYSSNDVVFYLGSGRQWQSSAIGSHLNLATQGANGGTYEDGGELICGRDLGGPYSVQFQETALRLIQFNAGSPTGTLFSDSKVVGGPGALSDRSVVVGAGAAFWPTHDDFVTFDVANGLRSIAQDKVRDWFFGRDGIGGVADLGALATMQGAYDPRRKMVIWAYKTLANQSTTTFTDEVCYHIPTGEWTTQKASLSLLTRLATVAPNADDLDSYGPSDSIDIAMDDPFWQGTAPFLAGLDADFKFASFSGGPQAATIRGCIINNPVSGLVGRATPISDCATSTLNLGVSDSPAVPIVFRGATVRGRGASVALRGRGLNLQFEEQFPAGAMWTEAAGVDHIQDAQGGPR